MTSTTATIFQVRVSYTNGERASFSRGTQGEAVELASTLRKLAATESVSVVKQVIVETELALPEEQKGLEITATGERDFGGYPVYAVSFNGEKIGVIYREKVTEPSRKSGRIITGTRTITGWSYRVDAMVARTSLIPNRSRRAFLGRGTKETAAQRMVDLVMSHRNH
jgi:hypothetical protein